jgi:type II secretory pathway pseudopilin PulG
MRRKSESGITIIELVIYIGLLSIFMLVLLDVFITVLNARLETESTSTLNQDTRYILTRLAYDIGNADSVVLPAALGDSGNVLKITKGGITETFSIDALGNLILDDGVSPQKLNGVDTALTDISFKKIGNPEEGDKPTVKISFTVKSLIIRQAGEQTRTVDTTIGTR